MNCIAFWHNFISMQGEVEQLQQIVAEHGGKLAKLLVGNSISNIAEVLRQTDAKSFTVLDLCSMLLMQLRMNWKMLRFSRNLTSVTSKRSTSVWHSLIQGSNRIKDIQWLPKLTCLKLERLRINDNLIEDGTPLTTASVRSAHLIEISTIRLESDGNRISDLTFLTKMDFTNLRQFSIGTGLCQRSLKSRHRRESSHSG
jgi:hypothetical protein